MLSPGVVCSKSRGVDLEHGGGGGGRRRERRGKGFAQRKDIHPKLYFLYLVGGGGLQPYTFMLFKADFYMSEGVGE